MLIRYVVRRASQRDGQPGEWSVDEGELHVLGALVFGALADPDVVAVSLEAQR